MNAYHLVVRLRTSKTTRIHHMKINRASEKVFQNNNSLSTVFFGSSTLDDCFETNNSVIHNLDRNEKGTFE